MRRNTFFGRGCRHAWLTLGLTAFFVVPTASAGIAGGLAELRAGAALSSGLQLAPYDDPTGDNDPAAPDIGLVELASNSTGRLAFSVHVTNRSGVEPGDAYLVLLNSDRRWNTGDAGIDYVLAVDGTGSVLAKWSGSWNAVSAPVAVTWADGPVIALNRKALGYTGAFFFLTGALNGENAFDAAPDDGAWLYRVGPNRCTIVGTVRNDSLGGTPANDTICGLAGADRLVGGQGQDVLEGGPGTDSVLGGPGSDSIMARDGARDLVDGGGGSDRAQVDRIDRVRAVEKRL